MLEVEAARQGIPSLVVMYEYCDTVASEWKRLGMGYETAQNGSLPT